MLEKDVLHTYEFFGKYGLREDELFQYQEKGIIHRMTPNFYYWKIIKPDELPKHNAIKSINNCLLFKSREKYFVNCPDGFFKAIPFDSKEGALEFMKTFRKFKTTTGSGYTVKFNREEMHELLNHFGDTHNIGIAIRRLL